MQLFLHTAREGQKGPMDAESLQKLHFKGDLPPDAVCWTEGMEGWVPVAEFMKAHGILEMKVLPVEKISKPVIPKPPQEEKKVLPAKDNSKKRVEPSSGTAAALTFSLTGLIFAALLPPLGILLLLAGIILAFRARGKLARQRYPKEGDKAQLQAAFGFGCAGLLVALVAMFIFAAIVTPAFLRARKKAQATKVLEHAVQIEAAKAEFARANPSAEAELIPYPAQLAPFLPEGSPLQRDAADGDDQILDLFGKPYLVNPLNSPPGIHPTTREHLEDVMKPEDWAPYGGP